MVERYVFVCARKGARGHFRRLALRTRVGPRLLERSAENVCGCCSSSCSANEAPQEPTVYALYMNIELGCHDQPCNTTCRDVHGTICNGTLMRMMIMTMESISTRLTPNTTPSAPAVRPVEWRPRVDVDLMRHGCMLLVAAR